MSHCFTKRQLEYLQELFTKAPTEAVNTVVYDIKHAFEKPKPIKPSRGCMGSLLLTGVPRTETFLDSENNPHTITIQNKPFYDFDLGHVYLKSDNYGICVTAYADPTKLACCIFYTFDVMFISHEGNSTRITDDIVKYYLDSFEVDNSTGLVKFKLTPWVTATN